jgi:hypothetical protein
VKSTFTGLVEFSLQLLRPIPKVAQAIVKVASFKNSFLSICLKSYITK